VLESGGLNCSIPSKTHSCQASYMTYFNLSGTVIIVTSILAPLCFLLGCGTCGGLLLLTYNVKVLNTNKVWFPVDMCIIIWSLYNNAWHCAYYTSKETKHIGTNKNEAYQIFSKICENQQATSSVSSPNPVYEQITWHILICCNTLITFYLLHWVVYCDTFAVYNY